MAVNPLGFITVHFQNDNEDNLRSHNRFYGNCQDQIFSKQEASKS